MQKCFSLRTSKVRTANSSTLYIFINATPRNENHQTEAITSPFSAGIFGRKATPTACRRRWQAKLSSPIPAPDFFRTVYWQRHPDAQSTALHLKARDRSVTVPRPRPFLRSLCLRASPIRLNRARNRRPLSLMMIPSSTTARQRGLWGRGSLRR